MPSLYNDLLNLGIADSDAQALGTAFENEPEWTAGLEQMAQAFFTDSRPATFVVTAKPWSDIYAAIANTNGNSITAAFQKAVAASVAPPLQIPLWDALSKVWNKVRATQSQGTSAGQRKRKYPKTAEYIKALQDLGYGFRMNTLHDGIEVNNEEISDAIQAEIRTKMRDKGYQLTGVMEDAYTAHAHVHRYHPIQEYLGSLAYDGGSHIADLASHVTDAHGVFHTWFRRWLIGAVAKAHSAEQNYMLVLDGKQGIGKSRFAQFLCSAMPGYFIEAPIDPDSKDCQMRLISKWIWEVAELGSTTRKADREALKFFLTQESVTVRRPYARYDLHKPALASFIGTINNDAGILSDRTGNRRFLIATVERLDWGYTDLDVNQVWAEAQAAYLAGEPWQLTQDEAKRAAELNEDYYEIEDPIEGLLLEHFDVDPDSKAWTPTTMILQTLEANGLKGNTRGNSMALASALRAMGVEKLKRDNSKGQRVWGYKGVRYTGTLPTP